MKNKKEGSDRNLRETRQTNTTIRIKNNTIKMASIHMTTLREKNGNGWISQDKEKYVEEKELGQRGEGESGEKKEKEDGG